MNLYDYNDRGEVIEADRFWGSDAQSPGDAVAGQYFAYDYDPIGNRTARNAKILILTYMH